MKQEKQEITFIVGTDVLNFVCLTTNKCWSKSEFRPHFSHADVLNFVCLTTNKCWSKSEFRPHFSHGVSLRCVDYSKMLLKI